MLNRVGNICTGLLIFMMPDVFAQEQAPPNEHKKVVYKDELNKIIY